MKNTHTYLNTTYLSLLNIAELQGYEPEQDVEYEAFQTGLGGISTIWFWLKCCVYLVTGHGEPLKSEVEFVERPYPYGRARRHREAHFAKRKDVTPSRCLTPFYSFGGRCITRGQFLERLCRLSDQGRIRVYHIIYYAHRLARYAKLAMFARGDFRVPSGLCAAHLWSN